MHAPETLPLSLAGYVECHVDDGSGMRAIPIIPNIHDWAVNRPFKQAGVDNFVGWAESGPMPYQASGGPCSYARLV